MFMTLHSVSILHNGYVAITFALRLPNGFKTCDGFMAVYPVSTANITLV